jgi:Domain of unknown function (DUF4249)
MITRANPYQLVLLALLLLVSCKKPFAPPAIRASNDYLVVDGIINTAPNSVTSININRTRNLLDTTNIGIPELNAQVDIVSNTGGSYPLADTGKSGIYISQPLTLDNNAQYSIHIATSDGRNYTSDPVACKKTPAIDSLYWLQPDDFTVYVDTHDPTNNTRYYRWQYIETWEHDAQLATPWGVNNDFIFATDTNTQKTICYSTQASTDIIVGTSENLADDVITQFPVHTIINPDERLNNKYSLLLKQYALTKEAFNYWQLIQKTSQQLGTFFDLQPAQLIGNIHSVNNPNEPVIGFMSASSVEEKRIFLYQTNLTNWRHNPEIFSCDTLEVPVSSVDYRIFISEEYPGYSPYYFMSTSGPLVLANSQCLDCTFFGGNTIRPPYWK